MLNQLDLNKMRTLLAVFQQRSVGAAAQTLHVSPSAVSQSLRSLEKEVGLQLFVRIGKRLEPTALAIELCAAAKGFLENLNALLESDQTQVISGKVKFGAPSLFGSGPLMKEVNRLRKKQPSITMQISLTDTKRLLLDLIDGRLDFAFLDSGKYPLSVRDIVLQPVATEELVLVCSTRFYRAHIRNDHSYKNLSKQEHIPYHDSQEAITKWYLHHFGKAPKFNALLMVDHPIAILNAIKNDLGLGVVPMSLVQADAKQKELVAIQTRKPALISQIVIAELKGKIYSKAQRTVVNNLKESFQSQHPERNEGKI